MKITSKPYLSLLLSDLQEYKQYKVELEEFKKLLADAQARNIDKDNIIRDNDYNINQLNLNVEKLTKDNQKEIDTLKKEHLLNTKLEIAEIKEGFNNNLSEYQLKNNKEIEQYQSRYKSLLEELKQIKPTPNVKKDNSSMQK